MKNQVVRYRKDGIYSQPFAFGGEEGPAAFDPNVRYRGSLQNYLIDTGDDVILVDTGLPAASRRRNSTGRNAPRRNSGGMSSGIALPFPFAYHRETAGGHRSAARPLFMRSITLCNIKRTRAGPVAVLGHCARPDIRAHIEACHEKETAVPRPAPPPAAGRRVSPLYRTVLPC